MLILNKYLPIASFLLFFAGPSLAATTATIDIQVGCEGGDSFHELSALDNVILANAVQESYNKLQGYDDSELSRVQVTPSQLIDHAATISGVMDFYEQMPSSENDIVMEGIKHQLWEANLLEILKDSGRPAFENLHQCKVRANVHPVMVNDDPEPVVTMKFMLYTKCNNLNLSKLSIPELMLMGRVIEDSYNKVHEGIEDDDSRIVDIHYGNFMEMSEEENLSGWTSGWAPSLVCRYCRLPPRKALLSVDQAMTSWENEVVSGLVGSGAKAFQKVKKCSFTTKFAGADAIVVSAEEPIKKCGVRACAENE